MKVCKGCGLPTVDPLEPARYDVMNPDADLDDPESNGPYDAACFEDTITGEAMAGA